MPVIRFFVVEGTGAAEGHRADMAEYFPLPLRSLDGERRTSAIDPVAGDETAVYEVEGQCVETNASGHLLPFSQRVSAPLTPQRCKARITSSREMIPASR